MITRHYVNLTERGLATDWAQGSSQGTINLNYGIWRCSPYRAVNTLYLCYKTSQSMLYREIIAVCSEIHTKHINTLCGQNVEFVVNPVLHIVTSGL